MIIRIRTKHGEDVARRLARFEAGRTVYISIIFFVDDMPGYCDYFFTTNRGAWNSGEKVTEVEL